MDKNSLSRRALLAAGASGPLLLTTAARANATGGSADDSRSLDTYGGSSGSTVRPFVTPTDTTPPTTNRQMASPNTVQTPGFTVVFNSGQPQSSGTYCGPAAGATALTNYRVGGVSQGTLANEAGTSFYGTTPGGLTRAINRYIPANQNRWTFYDHLSATVVWANARALMANGRVGGIVMVQSNRIWYQTSANYYIHYLLLTGYCDNYISGGVTYGRTFQVWDPQTGVHTLALRDWAYVSDTLVNDGVYLAP